MRRLACEERALHPAWVYMLRDAGGSLWGAAVFTLALFAPGYCVAPLLFKDMRRRGLREQVAWSVALSFGVGTIVVVALVWLTGTLVAGLCLLATGLVALALAFRSPTRVDISRGEVRRWLLFAAACTAIVFLSLIDLGLHNRLWMSVVTYDHSVRIPFVGAVMRTGVPPANPLYWPGHDAPMRYYYFWYVLCGVVANLAHISARQAFIGSCLWPIAGVVATLALFAKYMLGWSGEQLRKSLWLGVALLSVTGLDLLANFGAQARGDALYGDMEWWSIDQVSSWADTFLWVPHHAAALVCCLLAMLLLWRTTVEPDRKLRWKLACAAGLSFASAFGVSTYLAVGVTVIVTVWVGWKLVREKDFALLENASLAAGVAAALLIPYLAQLLAPGSSNTANTHHVLQLSVRRMLDPTMLSNVPGLRTLALHHPVRATNLAALPLLVPGYIAELGFFLVVLLAASRKSHRRSNAENTLLLWTWTGLAAVTFVRSQLLNTDDFGYRASLLPQFFLLLLAVIVLRECSRGMCAFLFSLAMIGVLGTSYQLIVLRTFLPWHELHHDPAIPELAERNYALRDIFSAIGRDLPPDARLQYDVSAGKYFMFAEMIQGTRQIVNADPGCATDFGGERSACAPIQHAVALLYGATPVESPEANQLCREIGAQYLILTRWDDAWNAPAGWPHSLPVVVSRSDAKVYACAPFEP